MGGSYVVLLADARPRPLAKSNKVPLERCAPFSLGVIEPPLRCERVRVGVDLFVVAHVVYVHSHRRLRWDGPFFVLQGFWRQARTASRDAICQADCLANTGRQVRKLLESKPVQRDRGVGDCLHELGSQFTEDVGIVQDVEASNGQCPPCG